MIPAARCPDRPRLERFVRADLPDGDASEIESHLETCDSCAASIHEISSEDPLMKGLRGGAIGPTEPRVDVLAEQFCRALPGLLAPGWTPEATGHGQDPPAPDGPGVGMTEEVFDFLAPPEGPGEIGRLGPYRVTGPIGAGGMGIVFRAEDPLLRRPVALKVMKRSRSAGAAARRRFLREAQAVAALDHDHVVAIYQVGEDRGVLFLAMPLLRGETLACRLQREGALPLPEALRVAREVAEGLDVAHRRRLVHRDIKPANLWLEGERGRVKILDFGLSRSLEPEADRSQSGQIAGTPRYMSPEQASGGPVTPLCDLFSLGCVLYQMTTGRVPFDGPDPLAILTALAVATPEPPDRLNPGLPRAASALITSLIARDPAVRPASARLVVEAIEAIERAPSPVAAPRRYRPAIILVLSAGLAIAGAGAALGPQVLRILGDKGQLVIETSDPGVKVEVKRGGQSVAILDPASGRRVDLHAGEYDLELSGGKDGLRLSTRRFALSRGGREVVRVTMERSPAKPHAGEADAARSIVPADLRLELDGLTARLRDRPDDLAALQARADAFAKAGDHDRALADWDRAIAIAPTEFRLQARGWAHFNKRDLDRALADFREAIRLDPKAPAPHTASATIHRFRGDFERARSEYDEAIRLDPTSALAFLGRGLFLLDRRDLGRALADFDEAIRLDPRGVQVRPSSDAFAARSEARRRQGNLEGAQSDADEAIRLEPGRATNYLIRSEVSLARRDYRAVLVDLNHACRLDPNDAFALAARCTARHGLGDLDGALSDGEASIRLKPDFPWAYHVRGLVRAARGEDDLAIADLTESLRRDPSLSPSLARRAALYEKRGELARARADRDEADRLVKGGAK